MFKSLLDLDFYKLSMGCFAFHNHRNVQVSYKFVLRTKNVTLLPFKTEIMEELAKLETLRLTAKEYDYVKDTFGIEYADFLNEYQFNNAKNLQIEEENGQLSIGVKGLWHETIYYETFVLSCVMEIYCRNNYKEYYSKMDLLLKEKIDFLNNINDSNFKIMEFGTRRRFSQEWQEHVLASLIKTKSVQTTSNVYLALKYGIPATGSIAHETFQIFQGIDNNVESSQTRLLLDWNKFYGDKYSIALTDILGLNSFLDNMTPYLAKTYKGFRHDSGDPSLWADNMIHYFKKNGINPKEKTLLFSDGLDLKSAYSLYLKYKDVTNVIFGIGTHLTNDTGEKGISIVMKIDVVNGFHTIKVSDTPEKAICSDKERLKDCLNKYKPLEAVDNE